MYVHENHHNSNDFQKVHKLITCTLQCKINVYVSTGVVKNSPDFYEIYKIKNNYIIVSLLKHMLHV